MKDRQQHASVPRVPAPYRDLTSPRAGAMRSATGNSNVDAVFKQVHDLDQFLNHVTAPQFTEAP